MAENLPWYKARELSLERKAAAETGVTEADYAKALTKIRAKESTR